MSFIDNKVGFVVGVSKLVTILLRLLGFAIGVPNFTNFGFETGALTKINFGGVAFLKALLNKPIKCLSLLLPDLPPKTTPIKRIPFLSTDAIKLNPDASI